MLQGRMLFVVAVLVSTAFADPDRPQVEPVTERPTAEAVAAAVAKSRADYAAAHPVPSKQQKIAAIRKQIDDTQTAMRRLTGTNAAKRVEQMYNEIKSLKTELEQVRRKYTPETITRLAAFKTGDLKIGSVGRINDEADQSPVFCVRVLEGDSMLAYIETRVKTADDTGQEASETRVKSPTFLLKGANASAAIAEHPITGAFDVVVTEKSVYEDDRGATQNVFVLEVFDPDRPFN